MEEQLQISGRLISLSKIQEQLEEALNRTSTQQGEKNNKKTQMKRREIEEQSRNTSIPSLSMILIQFIILIHLICSTARATSNINSVWLSKDAVAAHPDKSTTTSTLGQHHQHQQQQQETRLSPVTVAPESAANETHSRSSGNITLSARSQLPNRRSGDWLPATPHNLQTASSSLLPSIVAGDIVGTDLAQLTTESGDSQRRNDQLGEEQLTYVNNNNNNSAPVTGSSGRSRRRPLDDPRRLLEHLWLANQTNSQVQFDENEQHAASLASQSDSGLAAAKSSALNSLLNALTAASGSGSSASSSSSASTAADQLLEELATPASLPPQPLLQYSQNNTSTTTSSQSSGEPLNAYHLSTTNGNEESPQRNASNSEPYIYYLQNGDRWNLSANSDRLEEATQSGVSQESNQQLEPSINRLRNRRVEQGRRRFTHNSGTQYDLRDVSTSSLHNNDELEEPLTTSSYPNEGPPKTSPLLQYDFSATTAPFFDPTRAPRPHYLTGTSPLVEPPTSNYLPTRRLRTTPLPPQHHQQRQQMAALAQYMYPMGELVPERDYATTTTGAAAHVYLQQQQQQDLVPKQRIVGHPQSYRLQHQQHYNQQSPSSVNYHRLIRDRFPLQKPSNRSSAQETGARMLARDHHLQKLALYSAHRLPELISSSNAASRSKSLLTSLSNRLNSWDAKQTLENSFYDSNLINRNNRNNHNNNKRPIDARRPQRPRKPRPPNWSNTFYHLDAQQLPFATNQQQQQQHSFYGAAAPAYTAIQTPYLHHPAAAAAAFYQPYLTGASPLAVQQPTVGAPPNQLNRFYADGQLIAQPRRHRRVPQSLPTNTNAHYYGASSSQAAAHLSGKGSGGGAGSEAQNSAFIPVLAVSVSKTSPAPRPAAGDQPGTLVSDEYGQLEAPQYNQQLDDYASGSVSRDSQQVRRLLERQQLLNERRRQVAAQAAQHTTTVKSAVFGYVPHDSPANPLLRAVNMMPSANNQHQQHLQPHRSAPGDLYAGNTIEQVEPSGAAHYQLEPPIEEPPSLALQLQANSFVQNDIAHPFQQATNQQRKFGIGTIDVYPASQQQYHGFQLLNADQAAAAYSGGSGTGAATLGLLNPLLNSVASDGNLAMRPQMMSAAATDLEPLLPAALMYAAAATPGRSTVGADSQQVAASAPEVVHDQQLAASVLDGTSGGVAGAGNGAQLNNGGKKRSSEFFASAGQLLLSALPLLLAPTLGLMFASSPNQVARYHGAQPIAQASGSSTSGGGGGSSVVTPSLPSSYISNGLVSNGSPVPHLFTPTPPGYLLTTTTVSNRPSNKTAADLQRRKTSNNNNTTTTTTTTTTNQSNKTRQTTSSPKITVTVTTLNPGPNAAEFNQSSSDGFANSTSSRKIAGGHTIVLVTTDDDDSGVAAAAAVNASAVEQKVKSHYAIGYEGVDFDAQFPSLRKGTIAPAANKPPLSEGNASGEFIDRSRNHLDDNVLNLKRQTGSGAKNRYQYSEVTLPNNSELERRSIQVSSQPPPTTLIGSEVANDNSTSEELLSSGTSSRLYPVSTWPPSRRRTVQLVTSTGNKTLPDSSYKYPELDPSSQQLPARTKARSNKRNYTVSSVERADSGKLDEVGFVLSDGAGNFFDLVTSGAQSEQLASRSRRRRKRQVSSKPNELDNITTTTKPPAIRRRKVVKVKVKGASGVGKTIAPSAPGSGALNQVESIRSINTSAAEQQSPQSSSESSSNSKFREQLDGDSSKSKSAHIITTMITHLDDENEQDSEGGGGSSSSSSSAGDSAHEQVSANELREQLLKKKMLLDKISSAANHRMYDPRPSSNSQWQSEQEESPSGRHRMGTNNERFPTNEPPEQEDSFGAGGRGRFPTSSSNRREQQQQQHHTHRVHRTKQQDGGLVVIEDSIKIPQPQQESLDNLEEDQLQQHYNRRRRKDVLQQQQPPRRSEENWNRFSPSPPEEDRYGAFEASSTERSVTMADELSSSGAFRPLRNNSNATAHSSEWRRQPEASYQRPTNHLRQAPYQQQLSISTSAAAAGSVGGGSRARHNISRQSDDYLADLQIHNSSNNHLKQPSDGYGPLRPVRDRVNLIENELAMPGDDRGSSEYNSWPHYTTDRYSNAGSNAPGSKGNPLGFNSTHLQQQQQQQQQFNYNSNPTSSLHGYNLYTSNHINSSMNRQHAGSERQQVKNSNLNAALLGDNLNQETRYPSQSSYNHSSSSPSSAQLTDNRGQLMEHPYEQSYSNGHYGPSRQPAGSQQQQQQQQQQQPYTYETRYPSPGHYAASNAQEGHLPPGNHYTTYAPNIYQPSASHNTYPPPIMYHTNHKSSNSGLPPPPPPPYAAHQSQQQQQQVNYNHHQHQHRLEVDDYAPGYGLKVPPPESHQLDAYEQQQQQPPPPPPPLPPPLSPHKYYSQQPATDNARYSGAPDSGGGYLGGQPPPPNSAVDYHTKYTRHQHYQAPSEPAGGPQYMAANQIQQQQQQLGPLGPLLPHLTSGSAMSSGAVEKAGDSRAVNDYLKRAQFNDSDRDKLMASYLTCDGLLNDNDHCLERLSCEFSDPQNLEKANKLDRAVSSILLGHILINTYIPDQFKLRLKSASLFGYTQSGKCSRFVCHKLSRPNGRAA